MNGTDDIGMLKELVRREQESMNSNRRYSSLSRDIALTTAINEHMQHQEENLRALRGLAGDEFAVDDDVFEEQVYHDQPGGSNPKGYRAGGTAGTEPLSGARVDPATISQAFRERPAGENLGWHGTMPDDASFARTDSLLASKPPPDVASEDPAIVPGAKEAARLMVGSYAAAISQAVDPEVGEALELILRDCEDYLRVLERYRA